METKLVLEYNALTYVVFHCNVYTIHCMFSHASVCSFN